MFNFNIHFPKHHPYRRLLGSTIFSFPRIRAGNYTTCKEAPIFHAYMKNRKTKNKIGGRLPEGCITDPRNTRMGIKELDIEKNGDILFSDARAQKGL
jgi:hypothetical protein